MKKKWVEPDVRDEVVLYCRRIANESHLNITDMISLLSIGRPKYYTWQKRLGLSNKHNGRMPKMHWLTPDEKNAIVDFARKNLPENSYYLHDGYRRIAYTIMDKDI